MVPLHELLARIRWDPGFGKGEFALGYWDRVPFHRVRQVSRDGVTIWERPGGAR